MENVRLDAFSLLKDTDDTQIEHSLLANYNININDIYDSFNSTNELEIIDELFAHCYYSILKNEYYLGKLPTGIKFNHIFYCSRMEFVDAPFYKSLKTHSLLMTGYTLQDLISQDYMNIELYEYEHTNQPFKKVNSSNKYLKIDNCITPNNTLKRDSNFYKKLKEQILSINNRLPNYLFNIDRYKANTFYYRSFLPELDYSIINTHFTKDISKTFFNIKNISDAETYYINSLIDETITNLSHYYYHILSDVLILDSTIERLYYYFKLESIFGFHTLLQSLIYISEDKLKTNDLYLFHNMPNALTRFHDMSLYASGDYSKEDFEYVSTRLTPAITNTFYLLAKKHFKGDALNVITNYVNTITSISTNRKKLQILSSKDYKDFVQNSITANYDFNMLTDKLNCIYPSVFSDTISTEELLYRQFHTSWAHLVYAISNDFIDRLPSEYEYISSVIRKYKRSKHLGLSEKKALLEYLFNLYTSVDWDIPTSRLQ